MVLLLSGPADLSRLEASVERRIQERTWGRVRQLRVEAGQDRLVVRGCTPSYYVKQLAVQAVLEVVGWDAPRVDLDLQVSESAGRVRSRQSADQAHV
jgi:hypothetical protein